MKKRTEIKVPYVYFKQLENAIKWYSEGTWSINDLLTAIRAVLDNSKS